MVTGPSAPPPLLLPGTRTGRDPERSLRRGPRAAPAEVVAANQRDRLIDGFVRTVAQNGYVHTRVSDICRAAGVTRPVFYELFKGKEDAFLAAHRYGTGMVIGAMEEAHARACDWPDAVRAGLGTLLGILAEAPAFAAMAIVEIDAVGPAGWEAREQLLVRFRDFFTDLPDTPLPLPSEELVDIVVGGVYSAIHRRIAAGRAAELPALLPGLAFSVLAPFLGPERAAARLADPPPAAATLPACLTEDDAEPGTRLSRRGSARGTTAKRTASGPDRGTPDSAAR